jgi:pimeloyl-ACP methyl ester carboxylesterase
MNPFFFGDSDAPLFGVHHPPRGQSDLRRGVVLCAPMGQEYMRSHRAYRTLANMLSRRGFHVFRFDYFGTGDSAGESDEGDPHRWQRNVGQAIAELRDNADLDSVSLVGLRFGGSLAMLAAAERDDIDRVVLWDPVIRGRDFLDEILEVADPPCADDPDSGTLGVLGFPLTRVMREQIGKVDLFDCKPTSVGEVSLIVSSEDDGARALRQALADRGAQASYVCIPSAGSWNEVDNFGGALVPQEIIRGIVEQLSEGVE